MTGQPADIASSAYLYRADRKAADNPPEAWVLLMQYANLPFDKPVDVNAPAVKKALCGLLWEEVRPVRRVELSWPAETARTGPRHRTWCWRISTAAMATPTRGGIPGQSAKPPSRT